ncbi:concanavalin A-like lectin/glucanase domain-containing protein [Paraphoma chrysanthemicola]|uniref:chitinase n=1 Tax=Paraphoma chrysanthemicola TaxID=798071 RepID=A0A8K0R6B7_9PLEO|nr:concanavalin A-like lectin/glucanase domain-containing protein [Paraphoma chrysanthemicola]
MKIIRCVIRVVLICSSLTLAQTTTSCNPTEKTCPPDTALSSSTYSHDFTTGDDSSNWNVTAGTVSYTSSGAEFTINKAGDAPTIRSKWYIFFGRVSFHIRAAPGTGIVSSAILESDDLDEVDWEWIGGSSGKTQSNYFGKGNTTSYDRAVWIDTADTQSTSHNYTITWTSSAITWYVDNAAIRTLNYADALGGKNYPQTPMNVRIGIWAGGDSSNSEGTIEWAGGETNYDNGPFTMILEKVEVVNENPGGSYVYGDRTGDFGSIKVEAANESSTSASTSTETTKATSVAGESKTTGSATSTLTGMWWTASAEAIKASAQSSDTTVVKEVGLWGLGAVTMLVAWIHAY